MMGFDSTMVSTVAGDGNSGDIDAQGENARFKRPQAIYVDKSGSSGTAGDIYVNSYAKIKKIDGNGNVTTFAGTGVPGYQNGNRLVAQFSTDVNPFVIDENGNMYLCENSMHRIRKITPSGTVSLFAGSDNAAGSSGFINGTGSSVRFNVPTSMVYDEVNQHIYISDHGNNVIRRVSLSGAVTTYAGTGTQGHVDGQGSDARFNSISDMDVDEMGNLWLVDVNNRAIRKVTPDNWVSTIAGNGENAFRNGVGSDALMMNPVDVSCDNRGNVFFTDMYDNKIRKISSAIPYYHKIPLDFKNTNIT